MSDNRRVRSVETRRRAERRDDATPPLAALYLDVQRERIALTCAIMRLRGGNSPQRPRIVMAILIGLLRLRRANRKAAAALAADDEARAAAVTSAMVSLPAIRRPR